MGSTALQSIKIESGKIKSAKNQYGSKCLKLSKSSRNANFFSHLPKVLTLFHCVKVKQCYLGRP